MRGISRLLVMLALLVPAALGTVQAAVVWGRVVSADRIPVAGAKVYLRSGSTGLVLESEVTERGGDYSIPDLPPDSYESFVVTQSGAYLGTETIDTMKTASVVADLTLGQPASGEALPTADQFPGILAVPPAGYARLSLGVPGGQTSSKAKTGIVVGAAAGGIAVVALVVNAIKDSDDEPAATPVLP